MRMRHIALTLLFLAGTTFAQSPESFLPEAPSAASAAMNYFHAGAVASNLQVKAGEEFVVAVDVTLDEGWVYYANEPGGSKEYQPKAAAFSVLADGASVTQVLWPQSVEHDADLGNKSVRLNVYEGHFILFAKLRADTGHSKPIRIDLLASGQICNDAKGQCLELSTPAVVKVAVGEASIENPAWNSGLAQGLAQAQSRPAATPAPAAQGEPAPSLELASNPASELGVPAGLALAVLAGLILNIMPCVLPVIPLRILSVVEMAHESRRRYVTLGLAFAVGIVLPFVAMAGANAGLRLAAGKALNWGEQFQNSAFRIAMAMIVVGLAVNLLGGFTVLVPRQISRIEEGPRKKAGHLASLGMGLMMAVLATPCSFAILALAVTWAQLQPLWLASVAIILIGVGMAAPHAVLAAMPELLSRLPRPGRWMELLKHAMAFPLMLVAVWLISTLGAETYAAWVTGYGVVLAFCLWMAGSWVRYDSPLRRKILVQGLALVLAVAAGAYMLMPPHPPAVEFVPFNEQQMVEARQKGRVVLVDFTAAWCLSCKWVEYNVYDRPEVAEELRRRNVLAMRGDVTNSDSPARPMLYDMLKSAPPLTVVYPPDSLTPIPIEGKFSPADLFRALDKAEKKTK